MATRTAPTINAIDPPQYFRMSLKFIDSDGDERSDSYVIPVQATPAQIETFVAETAALTNASLYAVELTEVYEGVADPSNATNAARTSVSTNLVTSLKQIGQPARQAYIPAPMESMFIPEGETPLSGTLANYGTALLALVNAGGAAYSIQWFTLTERRERNARLKL